MRLMRFSLVGVAVALTYIGIYLAMTSAGVDHFMANGMAFFQAILLQYACQTAFTFQKPLIDTTQIVRFAAMVSLGFVSSALITGPVARLLGLQDWQAAVAVTTILPLQNYALMTMWVYATPASAQSDRSSS